MAALFFTCLLPTVPLAHKGMLGSGSFVGLEEEQSLGQMLSLNLYVEELSDGDGQSMVGSDTFLLAFAPSYKLSAQKVIVPVETNRRSG